MLYFWLFNVSKLAKNPFNFVPSFALSIAFSKYLFISSSAFVYSSFLVFLFISRILNLLFFISLCFAFPRLLIFVLSSVIPPNISNSSDANNISSSKACFFISSICLLKSGFSWILSKFISSNTSVLAMNILSVSSLENFSLFSLSRFFPSSSKSSS